MNEVNSALKKPNDCTNLLVAYYAHISILGSQLRAMVGRTNELDLQVVNARAVMRAL